MLNSSFILVNSTCYISEYLFPNFSHGASVFACCCVQDGEGGNPICMLLPGRALQGFGTECVTVHVCVYLEKLLWEALYIPPHGKNHFVDCVENQCHVSFSAWLCGARKWSMRSTWRRSDSTSNPSSVPDTCSCSHLILSSLLLFCPPSLPLMSSCASL